MGTAGDGPPIGPTPTTKENAMPRRNTNIASKGISIKISQEARNKLEACRQQLIKDGVLAQGDTLSAVIEAVVNASNIIGCD